MPEPGKVADDPASYRPISLLSCLGKTLERVIKKRIPEEFEENQYSFKRGRSTEESIRKVINEIKVLRPDYTYVTAVSLDIHGAFDQLYYQRIIWDLQVRNTPPYIVSLIKDYFRGRKVSVATKTSKMNRGCPQGIVLDPTLWNISYDTVLKILKEISVISFAFADDTLIIIPANTKLALNKKVMEVINAINRTFAELGLRLNYTKTEILLFLNLPRELKCDPDWVVDFLLIARNEIEIKRVIKYLGIMIDDRLDFRAHVDYIIEKVDKVSKKLQIIFRQYLGTATVQEGC